LLRVTISKQIVKRDPHKMAFKPTSTKGGGSNHEITVSTCSIRSTKIALPRALLRTHSIVIIFPRHTSVRDASTTNLDTCARQRKHARYL
jgi:hypothetical protein